MLIHANDDYGVRSRHWHVSADTTGVAGTNMFKRRSQFCLHAGTWPYLFFYCAQPDTTAASTHTQSVAAGTLTAPSRLPASACHPTNQAERQPASQPLTHSLEGTQIASRLFHRCACSYLEDESLRDLRMWCGEVTLASYCRVLFIYIRTYIVYRYMRVSFHGCI